MKKKVNLIILFPIIALISVFSVFAFYNFYKVVKVQEIPVSYDILIGSIGAGFSDKTELNFGILSPGSSTHTSIKFTNNFDFPVELRLIPEGNATIYMTLTDNQYVHQIGPSESKEIGFSIYAPKDIQGHFEGKITAKFIRK